MVRHETSSGHFVGEEFPDQAELTQNYTKLIRQVNSDNTFTAKEKQQAIKNLKGITRAEMKAIIETTGSTLHESIRKLIGSDRA